MNPQSFLERAYGPENRPFVLATGVCLITLLAFALRAYRIDWQSLWLDENFTVWLTAQDLTSITRITAGDVHPPLYYYLVHYWTLAAGQSEFSLRYTSLVFSVLLVPLMFRTACLLAGRQVGMLATLLIAVAPFQVYYAQEARMYTLVTLLSLVSLYALVKVGGYGRSHQPAIAAPHRSRAVWASVILSSCALLYVHYFGVLFLLVQNFAVLVTRLKDRAFFWKWCVSQAAVALLFAPWALVMLRVYATNDEPWRRHIPLLPMAQEIMVNLSIGESVEQALSLPLAAGFFLALLAGMAALAFGATRGRQLLLVLGLYLFLPILLAYLVSFSKPVYGGSRYFIFLAPALYSLIAVGLQALRKRWLPVQLVLLVWLIIGSGYSLANNYWNDAFAKDDYRGLARVVETEAGPDDGIVVMNGMVFDYYYKGSTPRVLLPQQYPLSEAQVLDELSRFSRGKSQLWLLKWKTSVLDPDNFIKRTMEEHGQKTGGGSIRELEYAVYRFPADSSFQATIGHPLEATFDGRISLEGYTLKPEKAVSGEPLDLALYMKASQPLDQDYKMAVSLRDDQGRLWAQLDRVPTSYPMARWRVGERVQARFRLNIPLGMPPGEYSLSLVAYLPASLQPLPVRTLAEGAASAALPLGKVEVTKGQLPYDAASLNPAQRTNWDGAPGIRLLGYDTGPSELEQGQTISVALYWQAVSRPQTDYDVWVRLLDESGRSIQESRGRPHSGLYPTLGWEQGEIVRDTHSLQVPANAPTGRSRIEVSLVSSAPSEVRVTELGPVMVKARSRSFEIPVIERPSVADFGRSVRLLGYALDREPVRPGGKVSITMYWQALTEGTVNYTVFAHLLDGQERVLAQHDGPPSGGTQPTSSWMAGQTVTDLHELPLSLETPPGEYAIEVGMYDPNNGQRLRLPDGQDRIILDPVRVQ